MAEIVETEVAKFGGAAMAEEGFGDTVRFPRGDSVVVGEDIPVRWWRCDEGPVEHGEHGEGDGVDVDGVRAFGRGRGQDGIVGSFDPASAERDPGSVDVDVVPAQTEQLRTPRPGHRRDEQKHVQERVAASDESSSDRNSAGVGGRISFGATTIR